MMNSVENGVKENAQIVQENGGHRTGASALCLTIVFIFIAFFVSFIVSRPTTVEIKPLSEIYENRVDRSLMLTELRVRISPWGTRIDFDSDGQCGSGELKEEFSISKDERTGMSAVPFYVTMALTTGKPKAIVDEDVLVGEASLEEVSHIFRSAIDSVVDHCKKKMERRWTWESASS